MIIYLIEGDNEVVKIINEHNHEPTPLRKTVSELHLLKLSSFFN